MPLTKCDVLRCELIEDMQRLQLEYPGPITRNFYRAHGSYSESEWQYHFPTFGHFLAAATDIQPTFEDVAVSLPVDLDPGDTFKIDGKRYKLLKKRGSAISVRRQYWFDDIVDWVSDKVAKWAEGS